MRKNPSLGRTTPRGKDFALLKGAWKNLLRNYASEGNPGMLSFDSQAFRTFVIEYFKALNQWLAGYSVFAQATTTAAPSSTSSEVVRTNPVAQISALFAHWA
jgi:hypothetical protein